MAQEMALFSGFEVCDAKARESIEEINKKINDKYIFVGDSYGVGITDGENVTSSWVDYFVMAGSIPVENYYKRCEAGCGFVTTGTSGNTFLSLLETSEIADKDSITKIVVCGGMNDVNQSFDSIDNAINSFTQYCKANFPNAKVYLGMIGSTKDTTSYGKNARYNLSNIVLRVYQYACRYGAIYLNGVERVLKYYYLLSSDNNHPTQNGYYYLGGAIYQAVENGSCRWSFNELVDCYLSNSNILTNNFRLKMKMFNDSLFVGNEGGNIIFHNSVGLENNNYIDLGELISSEYLRKVTGSVVTFSAQVNFRTDDNRYYGGNCMFNFDDSNHLLLFPRLYLNNGENYISLANVKEIEIMAFNYTIPIELI